MGKQYSRPTTRFAGRGDAFIESLEERRMLSASSSAATLEADGAVPVLWKGEHTFAAPGQWIVILDRPAGSTSRQIRQINKQLAGQGIRAVRRLNATNIFLFRGVQKPINEVRATLGALKGFKNVEPDVVRVAQGVSNDPRLSEQWGLNQANDVDIDAPEAWDLSTGSRTVITAIIDTGVDYNHPDLAANMFTNPNEIAGNGKDDDGNGFIDDVRGWDFAN